MSERIYWRHTDGSTVDYAASNRSVIAVLDGSPDWQRVHVLTPEELAARDAEVLRAAANDLVRTLDPFLGYQRFDFHALLHDRADQIEAGGRGE